MITIDRVSKNFGTITAVNALSLNIENGKTFGLLGTNGAGKSTLMRMISGIIQPDAGAISVDGQNLFTSMETKAEVFFIPDEDNFFPNSCAADIRDYYAMFYPNFNKGRMNELLAAFDLAPSRQIRTYSKGMKKQLSMIVGISAGTRWLLCDETFDGLDPVVRQAVKTLLVTEMCDRDFTPIIASHNLRELEDVSDHVGLLHKGGILLSKDLQDLKKDLHKFQFAKDEDVQSQLTAGMTILSYERRGSLVTMIARGDKDMLTSVLFSQQPLFMEELPLSLEEIFIHETGVYGYDVKNLIM